MDFSEARWQKQIRIHTDNHFLPHPLDLQDQHRGY
jgi:hypothetical protein